MIYVIVYLLTSIVCREYLMYRVIKEWTVRCSYDVSHTSIITLVIGFIPIVNVVAIVIILMGDIMARNESNLKVSVDNKNSYNRISELLSRGWAISKSKQDDWVVMCKDGLPDIKIYTSNKYKDLERHLNDIDNTINDIYG